MDLDGIVKQTGVFSRRVNALRDFIREDSAGLDERREIPPEFFDALEELEVASEELTLQGDALAAAQAELESSLARYRDLFDLAPDGYLVTDVNGIVREANLAATRLLNVDRAKLTGKPLAVFVPLADRPKYRTQIERARGMERLEGWELRMEPRDRPLVYTTVTVVAIRDRDGGIGGLRWTIHDITERKLAEGFLWQQSQRLQVINSIERAILASQSPAHIARAATEQLRDLIPCQHAAVLLLDESAEEAEVLAVSSAGPTGLPAQERLALDSERMRVEYRFGRTRLVKDLQNQPNLTPIDQILAGDGLRALLEVPMFMQRKLLGVLQLGRSTPGRFEHVHIEIAHQLADALAVAIQNRRLWEEVQSSHEQLQGLTWRLVEMQEAEWKRIAYKVHDATNQDLAALLVGLALLERSTEGKPAVEPLIADLKRLLGRVLEELHDLAAGLRPVTLDKLGLLPALHQRTEEVARRHGLKMAMQVVDLEGTRLARDLELALYRVVEESLDNVVRHAGASQAAVLIERRGRRVVAIVEDDGKGFDPKEIFRRSAGGLLTMRQRCEMVGGKLTIESSAGNGTTVYAQVPYRVAEDA